MRIISVFHAADTRLFRKAISNHSPSLDRVLFPLSKAANRSVLWMGLAAVLGVTGGRFGRRAALRGMISLAMTSAVANLPLKSIARRKRPEAKLLPKPRRLIRRPVSYSFPSGHAASAAAFATGAGMEAPRLAAPLGAVAAAVAYSRVYSGVHYPGDVAAGAAIGTAIALSTRRWWPMASTQPASRQPVKSSAVTEASRDGEGFAIVTNPEAGPALSKNPADDLRHELPNAEVIEVAPEGDFGAALKAASSRAKILGVAGGDGSVAAAAELAAEQNKPLMVVPAGTLNHFARDLELSSVQDAIDAVHKGQTIAVDTGTIDGRLFLNTASFGGYADLVDARERLESKIGKWPALLAGLVKVLRHSTPVDVRLNGTRRTLWMIFIGNCCYQPSGFAPNSRRSMNDGLLDVRLVDGTTPWARIRLLSAVLTGTLANSRVFEQFTATQLEIESLGGPLRLARDGETFDGSAKFTVAKGPRPLAVFAPYGPE